MRKKISFLVKCPHCRELLMDDENKSSCEEPSIRLNIETKNKRGTINICSVYECYESCSSFDIEKDEIVDFYCPKCNKGLKTNTECEVCGAPMIEFVIKSGGRISICSRKGCINHNLKFKSISVELSKFYDRYEL